MKTITAAEANRNFSKLLRQAESGETVLVTSHGRPIARIAPAFDQNDAIVAARRCESREVLFKRLRAQPSLNVGKMTRDEIYDDVIFGEKQ